jgi:GNAT superfamily N-acetyltransferase
VIERLVDEAAKWLRGKGTNQWADPWPDLDGRNKRIEDDLAHGRTWLLWDDNDDVAVATITIDAVDPVDPWRNQIWPTAWLAEEALYVHRVVVRRSHAGRELGAMLLDWASGVAERQVGSPLLRVDVWTDNTALHQYYEDHGFELCHIRDERELPGYPARALFERRTSPNGNSRHTQNFIEQLPSEQ